MCEYMQNFSHSRWKTTAHEREERPTPINVSNRRHIGITQVGKDVFMFSFHVSVT